MLNEILCCRKGDKRHLVIVDKGCNRKRQISAVVVLVFNDQSFVFFVNGILVIRKQVNEVHGCVAKKQQDGKPHDQDVFGNFSAHCCRKCRKN